MLVMKAGVPKLRIDELAFSPDGATVAAPAGAAGVCLWSPLSAGAKADVLQLPAKVAKRLAFSPDGRTLFAGNDQLCAFDLGDRTGALAAIPKWAALRFGVSPDGRRLVVAETPQGADGSRLTIWATGSLDAPVREVTFTSLVYSAPLFPPGGERFLLLEGTLLPDRRWEYRRVTRSAETGEVLERSDPLPDDPDQMVLSPDGRAVACRTRNVIRIYPSAGGWGKVPEIANEGKQHFTGIAYHPSWKLLAATSNDKTVKLYDTASGQLSREFTWEIGRMRSVAFSPDGLLAAGSDTGKVVVWDVDG
ncbi:MAG: WD40 repeat domain-containing protein [Bryobacteraceae bacterium]|nr:WD40 repeat domain-containing protein [Bryobacteraceae bacterium]